MASSSAKRFAPLNGTSSSIPSLKGVVFDMDGSVSTDFVYVTSEPQNYMFGEMRDALKITKAVDILDHIAALPADEQPAAHAAIEAIERAAMAKQAPQPGLNALMTYLDSRGIKKAICTRNFDIPVDNLLTKFLSGSVFHPVVTREFRPPKPHPAGILHIAKAWGHETGDGLIMVGDSIDDMAAGRAAGAATVLLVNEVNKTLVDHEFTDLVIHQLDDLVQILENGFQGRPSAGTN
ncbi:hypothetical protein Golomagni_06442 [Golovinomyces magnicellulatus]|nr:hypothetical protein Golomagni_06442 [Golovinomyces magnicellulatus]